MSDHQNETSATAAPSRINSRVAWKQQKDEYDKGQPERQSRPAPTHVLEASRSRAPSGRGQHTTSEYDEETATALSVATVKRSSSKASRRESSIRAPQPHAALVPDDESTEALKRQLSQLLVAPAALLGAREASTASAAAAVLPLGPPTLLMSSGTHQPRSQQAAAAGRRQQQGAEPRGAELLLPTMPTADDDADDGKWRQQPAPPNKRGGGGQQRDAAPGTTVRCLRAAARRCGGRCGGRLPRGCLAPMHALLLMVLLMGGVVPLYLYNLRLVATAKTSSTFLCALYPAYITNSVHDIDAPRTPDIPPFPPDWPTAAARPPFPLLPPFLDHQPTAPPAPPGGGSIASPASEADCERELQTLFDPDLADDNPWQQLAGLVRFGFTIQDVEPRKFVASAIVDFELPPSAWPSCKAVVLSATYNNEEETEYSCYEEYVIHERRNARSYLVQIEKVPIKVLRDLSLYPFDRYEFRLTAELKYVDTRETGVGDYDYTSFHTNNTMFAPFVSRLVTRSPAFSFDVPNAYAYSFQETESAANGSLLLAFGGSLVSYTVHVNRTLGVKIFVVLVFGAMWGLALFALVHALDAVVLRPHATAAVGYDAPAYAAAMLFALPTVRQMLPGVPDMGAMVDICGFYWNMAILALVCCMFVARIYAQSRADGSSGARQQGTLAGDAGGSFGSAKVLPV